MRALLAALLCAPLLACAFTPARALPTEPYRAPTLAMLSAIDLLRAMRCPPPFGCADDRPPEKSKSIRKRGRK